MGRARDSSEVHPDTDTRTYSHSTTNVAGEKLQHADPAGGSPQRRDSSGLTPPQWGQGQGQNQGQGHGQAQAQGLAVMPMEQQGVLRTNCIDCLDRTNVGQFSIAVHALAKQIYVMGVSNQTSLDSGSQVLCEVKHRLF